MCDCQPGPPALNADTTSGDNRIDARVLVGAFYGPPSRYPFICPMRFCVP